MPDQEIKNGFHPHAPLPIDTRTCLFGVIGDPVGHSLSPVMHNAALAAMGYPGIYLAFQVSDPAGALSGMRAFRIRGLSVTIPHKIAVMEHLDEIDPLARRIGAVNTIVNRNGHLIGFNTDCYGAVAGLKAHTGLKDKQVAVLGAGGAARAVAFGLAAEGARVTIFNRSIQRAEALAQALHVPYCGMDCFDGRHMDIVVNTTSVGMTPRTEDTPIAVESLKAGMVVMDIVYNPLQTALLRAAAKKNCITIDGVAMFVHQGARQLELWTGRRAPVTVMRETVLKNLSA
jgi:shikimate dehydrogenase